MESGIIYMYTSPSGKKYIGQTWNERRRKREHNEASSKCVAFQSAIKKYGKDSFLYEILHTNIETQKELNFLEAQEIKRFNTIAPNGYNLTTGGEGGKHNEISKQKIRNLWEKNKSSRIKTLKEAAKRPEVRERLRQNAINNANNAEIVEKKSKKLKELFASDEVKKARSDARTREWADPKIRKKRMDGMRKSMDTDKYKQRKSEIMIERWASEEFRAHMKTTLTGKVRPQTATDAAREKRIVPVICVETGLKFKSVNEAAKFAKVSRTCVSGALTGKQKTAGGYKWEYANEKNEP